MLVHRKIFHEEIRDPQRSPAGKSAPTEALDVHFTLSALPDMPGHKPQTECQNFNAPQPPLRRRSRAVGPGPGPDGAHPALGEVTVTPSGHFGKAPSEHSATFQGLQRPKQKRGDKGQRLPQGPPPHSWHVRASVPLFALKGWCKGTKSKARWEFFPFLL